MNHRHIVCLDASWSINWATHHAKLPRRSSTSSAAVFIAVNSDQRSRSQWIPVSCCEQQWVSNCRTQACRFWTFCQPSLQHGLNPHDMLIELASPLARAHQGDQLLTLMKVSPIMPWMCIMVNAGGVHCVKVPVVSHHWPSFPQQPSPLGVPCTTHCHPRFSLPRAGQLTFIHHFPFLARAHVQPLCWQHLALTSHQKPGSHPACSATAKVATAPLASLSQLMINSDNSPCHQICIH